MYEIPRFLYEMVGGLIWVRRNLPKIGLFLATKIVKNGCSLVEFLLIFCESFLCVRGVLVRV